MKPVKTKYIPPPAFRSGPLKSNFYKRVYLTVFLFFSGLILSVTFGFRTMIPLSDLTILFLSAILISIMLQMIYYRDRFPMRKMEFLMLSFLGFGPLLTGFALVLNYFVIIEKNTGEYKAIEINHYGNQIIFKAEGMPCERFPEFCKSDEPDVQDLRRGELLSITLGKGILGYRVIKEIEIIRP